MNLKLAAFISYVFNPLLILVLLPFVLVYEATGDTQVSIFWTAYTFIFLLLIAAFVLFGVRRKFFTNIDVSNRQQRPLLFYFLLFIALLYLGGLYLLHAPRILFIVTVSMIFGIGIVSGINTKIKASLHVATVAALILGLTIGYGGYYLLLLLLVPLVGWSRVKLKRHTVSETVVGGIVGSILLLAIYTVFEAFLK
ncbi:MAG TPA: hypothetical protein VNA13_01735 [Xanthomonadales bacterium]|nr:hypothetical protein [Xanthomonadales bacterium]